MKEEIYGFDGEGPFTPEEFKVEAAKLRASLAPHDRPGSVYHAAVAAKRERARERTIAQTLYNDDGLPHE